MAHYKKKQIENEALREKLENPEPYEFRMAALTDCTCVENAREVIDCLTELIEENKAELSMNLTAKLLTDGYNHTHFLLFVSHQLTKAFLPEGNGRRFQGVTRKQMRAVREVYDLYIQMHEAGEYGHNEKVKRYICSRYGMDISSLERKMKNARTTIAGEYNDRTEKLLPDFRSRPSRN